MYVVLKGSIVIRKLRSNYDGEKENAILHILYDGEYFGDKLQ